MKTILKNLNYFFTRYRKPFVH